MAKKKEEDIKCYDCGADLDMRNKANVLRDKGFEWICGSCNKKEVLKTNKTITKTTIKSDKPKPFYEKGIIGKAKRYIIDDTMNDIKKIGKNITDMGEDDKE